MRVPDTRPSMAVLVSLLKPLMVPSVAAEMHLADRGDTATLPGTLESAARHLAMVEAAPSAELHAEMVADKGYHSREVLISLDHGPWKTRIAEPKCDGF